MTEETLSEKAKDYLIGKTIVSVGQNYIVLADGCRIYIDDIEIKMLN